MIVLPDAEIARSYLHSPGQNSGIWCKDGQNPSSYYSSLQSIRVMVSFGL